jgi:hypothetical protein
VLAYCSSRDEMNKLEAQFIEKFKTVSPDGYNLTTGGDRREISQETRKKLSIAGRRFRHSEETKARISASHKGLKLGIKLPLEVRMKMSKSSAKHRSKKVVDIATGFVWDSCLEAADIYGFKRETLSAYLLNKIKNKTNLRYV